MLHRKTRRQLGFESLEAMELLSGAGASAAHAVTPHPVALVHRAPMAPVNDVAVNLSGSVKGTYRVVHGSSASFTGNGSVSPFGKARMQGTIAVTSTTGGQLTLNFGKSGKVFASLTGLTATGGYTYQVTGGTKTFAGDTGAGVAVVNILSSNATGTRGRFSLALQPLTT